MTPLFALAAGLAAAAQAASTPPAVGPLKPFALPPRVEWRLANGLEVVLVEDHRLPMVTATLAMRAGDAAVAARDAGLARAMAELLTDGTGKKTSREIAEAADRFGGSLSAAAGADSIELEARCLSEHVEEMFALMAETAREAAFPEAEVALRRRNMQEELNVSRGQPDFLARVAFQKRFFAGHPYATMNPTDASIARLTRARVAAAHAELLSPKDAVLVLVGDLAPAQARALLEKHLGSWTGGAGPAGPPPARPRVDRRRVFVVDRPGSAQVWLLLGGSAAAEADPAYFDLLLAEQILGGSFASRLVSDLRETKGYTYVISSSLEHDLAASVFHVETPVRREVIEPMLSGILAHLERLRAEPPSEEELAKAKNFLAGIFSRSLETQAGLVETLVHLKLLRLPSDFYDRYVERVQAVGAEGVMKAARAFIRPDELVVVAVGDAAKIKSVLAKFSEEPVVVLNQDGD